MATPSEGAPERVGLGPCEADLYRAEAAARVVVLPGAGYSTQAPLLWFARGLALARGAGVLAGERGGRVPGDPMASRAPPG